MVLGFTARKVFGWYLPSILLDIECILSRKDGRNTMYRTCIISTEPIACFIGTLAYPQCPVVILMSMINVTYNECRD